MESASLRQSLLTCASDKGASSSEIDGYRNSELTSSDQSSGSRSTSLGSLGRQNVNIKRSSSFMFKTRDTDDPVSSIEFMLLSLADSLEERVYIGSDK